MDEPEVRTYLNLCSLKPACQHQSVGRFTVKYLEMEVTRRWKWWLEDAEGRGVVGNVQITRNIHWVSLLCCYYWEWNNDLTTSGRRAGVDIVEAEQSWDPGRRGRWNYETNLHIRDWVHLLQIQAVRVGQGGQTGAQSTRVTSTLSVVTHHLPPTFTESFYSPRQKHKYSYCALEVDVVKLRN